jgi:AhpD family alkylhydroperoxidase
MRQKAPGSSRPRGSTTPQPPGCRYCVDAHVLFLDLIGAGPHVVDAARVASVDDMPVEDNLRELLRFVQRIDHEAYKIVDAGHLPGLSEAPRLLDQPAAVQDDGDDPSAARMRHAPGTPLST